MTFGLPWTPGVRPPLAAPRQLASTPLTTVTDPAAGVMPEAPQAIVATSTASILRAGSAIATAALMTPSHFCGYDQ